MARPPRMEGVTFRQWCYQEGGIKLKFKDFVLLVLDKVIEDQDGLGYLSIGDLVSDLEIRPSFVGVFPIPKWGTHVLWHTVWLNNSNGRRVGKWA